MEYLKCIDDPCTTINTDNIVFFDLMKRPEFFFGLSNISSDYVDFCKFPPAIREENKQFGKGAEDEMNNLYKSASADRLRFQTTSHRIVLKAQLKRAWGYRKLTLWNSSGFDVYEVNGEKYTHRTVLAPYEGTNIFAESLAVPPSGKMCIFLPNYNTIEALYFGIEKDSKISPLGYQNNLPVLFYGNSVTQGASASRSGNSFVNIVSRKLDRDVINFSCSSCCRGLESTAELLGRLNCHSIVVDFTRNAYSTKVFRETYDKFYQKLRSMQPQTKIILMTSANWQHWRDYDEFDEIVVSTWKAALERHENVKLLNQRQLFQEDEYDLVAVDGSHYTDYGMFRVADKICELLRDV